MFDFIFGIVAMICWACSDVLASRAIKKDASSFQLYFWSQIIRTGIYLILALPFLTVFRAFTQTDGIVLPIIGLLNVVCYLLFYSAFVVGDLSIISPIVSAWSVFAVVLSVIFLHQFLTPLETIAIVIVFTGTFFAAFHRQAHRDKRKFIRARGTGYALASSVGWGVSFVLMNILITDIGWLASAFIVSSVSLFIVFVFLIFRKMKVTPLPKEAMIPIIGVGFLEAGGLLAYNFGVQLHGTSYIAPISTTFPLLTVILARIFFKEKPQFHQIIGILLIVTGLVLLVF